MNKKVNMSNITSKLNYVYKDECEKNIAAIVIYNKDGEFFFDPEYKNVMTNLEVEALLLRGALVDTDGRYYRPSSFNDNNVSLQIENDINSRSINVTNLFTEKLTDDNTSIQLYNALKYCADNGYTAFIPGGTYIVSKLTDISIDNAAALVIPKGCDVIFGKGVIFKLKPDSPSWTRTVVLHGDNNLYGHFEIDGSASTITAGNEHMAGLFMYGKSDIYVESVYSHDCYGDNVQISGSADELGRNVIIDRLRCKNAGRKSLVFEGTTNIHIKNAYLDNGGCLDVEPFGGDVECYYRIDRLEATGSSDFTAGTTKEKGRRYILDVGTWIQREGTFLSYALCINIDTAVFYDVQINQTYGSYINIRNAFFIYPTREIIDSRRNTDMPNVNINTAKVFGTGTETFNNLIYCQGGMLSINNLEVYNVNAALLYYQATATSNVYFGNLYLENSGRSGEAVTYLAGHGERNGNIIFDNVVINDTRETTVTKMLDVVTASMIDKVKMHNYIFTPNTISPGSSHYGNFVVNVHGNGANTQYRPTNIKIGYQYYDTSLKKPIWWDGTKWTDATGAEV